MVRARWTCQDWMGGVLAEEAPAIFNPSPSYFVGTRLRVTDDDIFKRSLNLNFYGITQY